MDIFGLGMEQVDDTISLGKAIAIVPKKYIQLVEGVKLKSAVLQDSGNSLYITPLKEI
jgi:hypothetical protein